MAGTVWKRDDGKIYLNDGGIPYSNWGCPDLQLPDDDTIGSWAVQPNGLAQWTLFAFVH
jgi:hypothetical protein